MKCIQRIPTVQFGYVELEMEYETPEEAFIDHERLCKLHEGGTGLSAREWTQVRTEMLNSGECNPETIERMNKAQRYWINETKLALRTIKKLDNNSNEND